MIIITKYESSDKYNNTTSIIHILTYVFDYTLVTNYTNVLIFCSFAVSINTQ